MNSTDPGATFSPKTFIVNFGRIVGNGVFAVTFSTVGVQRVSTTITSNMGSPAVRGHFVSPANEFNVVTPLIGPLLDYLGWLMGFEPTTTGITIRDSTAELQPPS